MEGIELSENWGPNLGVRHFSHIDSSLRVVLARTHTAVSLAVLSDSPHSLIDDSFPPHNMIPALWVLCYVIITKGMSPACRDYFISCIHMQDSSVDQFIA